jgi:hypothetical protein
MKAFIAAVCIAITTSAHAGFYSASIPVGCSLIKQIVEDWNGTSKSRYQNLMTRIEDCLRALPQGPDADEWRQELLTAKGLLVYKKKF